MEKFSFNFKDSLVCYFYLFEIEYPKILCYYSRFF